ncbi:MAG: MBL fold metallo-hydrolase [Candidatus Pacebacteria bacterium]|nr:MBL fold metallo-hydrolase [Candidatus Paceibacterota bacterium]MBP9866989.1 MBL fold metallo-hydrolase [Candidatus Paceibacterota bacterium]
MYLFTLYLLPQKLRVSFLDVGQGDAILIQTPSGKQMLIDGGVSNSVMSKISDKMFYFDKDIDVLVATHPDADHITGLIPVLEKYFVGTIITSPLTGETSISRDLDQHILKEGSSVHVAKGGDEINFHDGVIAYVVYPLTSSAGSIVKDTNDVSVSVVVVYGDHSFLLTGDLSTYKESELFLQKIPEPVTVYKAGHHGSKYSSGETLLSYIKPEYVVISAGRDNSYGHPHNETVERIKKFSKEIISTIDRGTITFVTDGKTIILDTEK